MPNLVIEILKAGTHTASNGEVVEFKPEDLQAIATNYNPTNFRAPLIVSHKTNGVDDKKLADTEFAFGFPDALVVAGDRLKAIFSKIAPEFVQWVRDGRLFSVSPSFYLPNSPGNPTPGILSLRHIAALGASPPAIKGLQPLSLSQVEEIYLTFAQKVVLDEEIQCRLEVTEDAELPCNYKENSMKKNKLSLAIASKKMDAAKVAEAAGMDEEEVASYMDSSRKPSKGAIGKISKVLEMESADLMEEEEEMEEEMVPKKKKVKEVADMEEQTKDYSEDIESLKEQLQQLERSKTLAELELQRAKDEAGRAHRIAVDMQQQARRQEIASFCEALEKEGRLLPAQSGTRVVEFGEDREELTLVEFMDGLEGRQLAFMRDFLASSPVQVDFGEYVKPEGDRPRNGTSKLQGISIPDSYIVSEESQEAYKAVLDYCEKNGLDASSSVDFEQAANAVLMGV